MGPFSQTALISDAAVRSWKNTEDAYASTANAGLNVNVGRSHPPSIHYFQETPPSVLVRNLECPAIDTVMR